MRYIIFISGLIFGIFTAAAPALATDVMDGKTLFEANCAKCHGKDGTVSDYGKQLKPFPARNLRAVAKFVDRDELRRIITYGIHGTAMTPKKYALDASDIEAVIDYIESFDYKPNLKHGRKRFLQVCSQCHGKDGRARTGIGAKNLVYSKLDLKGIVHTIRYGRFGTMMTAKRHQLSNTDIADIANDVFSLRYQANRRHGGKLYGSSCISCHATPAKIRLVGNEAQKRSIDELDNYQLELRIRHGRHINRAGRHITKLSDDDVQDIIAYIRAWRPGK